MKSGSYLKLTLQYVLKSLEYDSPLFISLLFRFCSFSFFPYCFTILESLLFHVSQAKRLPPTSGVVTETQDWTTQKYLIIFITHFESLFGSDKLSGDMSVAGNLQVLGSGYQTKILVYRQKWWWYQRTGWTVMQHDLRQYPTYQFTSRIMVFFIKCTLYVIILL